MAACTSQVGGQANPSSSAANSPAPSTVASGSPFAGLNPCTMLDQALAGQDFPPATPTIARSKESCGTNKLASGNTPGVDVALSLQAGQSYRDNVGNPSQASEGKVNGRPAVEEREPEHSSGQCGVWLDVKPQSRALVLVSSSSDTARACQLVGDIAAKVEPLLPKN
ncbi:DUF3558 family protein [Amycolatopsis kentuckyensis]|uniref:DUF3558 family protein n=1 Tax=Amycolatopsis kentuckyensis TaxID=218823 RepID=UPI001FC9018E|nr:DUF3558 family protein [Amycolatopsis kentuckyensis]